MHTSFRFRAKSYPIRDFVREPCATLRVARHTTGRSSATDGHTPRHARNTISQQRGNRGEEVSGWLKDVCPGVSSGACQGNQRAQLSSFATTVANNGLTVQEENARRKWRIFGEWQWKRIEESGTASLGLLVRPAGVEPAASGFEARRSVQLSYGRTQAILLLWPQPFLRANNPR